MGVVVGTAGHIDHGKSALVMALTGKDPDRLEEEKRRGITIELGYVFMPLQQGRILSFIDVPGHEKFVRTMVAGVATVDMFLLVVSADEGVMPQTTEHLDILRLLEVDKGVVALSKCDLVELELQDLAEEEVREALQGTPAQDAPIIRISAVTGQGIESLKELLEEMAGQIIERDSGKNFRMPVDRIFTLKGFGTIVCGTGLSGTVSVGDTLELMPGGKKYRVRELGVNDTRNAKSAVAGDRIALNLVGLHKDDIERGQCFGTPGTLISLSSIDGFCNMLDGSVDLKPRQRVRFHVGTAEVMARAIPVDGNVLPRGTSGYVHFQLEHEVVALPGDRFVIRRYSPVTTIGGGTILETGTRKIRSKRRDERIHRLDLLSSGNAHGILEGMLEASPRRGFTIKEALKETGASEQDLETVLEVMNEEDAAVFMKDGSTVRVVSAPEATRISKDLVASVDRYHSTNPLSYGLPIARISRALPAGTPSWFIKSVISGLEDSGVIERRGGDRLALTSHPAEIPDEMLKKVQTSLRNVRNAGFSGVRLTEAGSSTLIEALVERGLLICLSSDLVASPEAVEDVIELIADRFAENGFRLGELREALGVSRKIALMWAEFLDGMGRTRRTGDLRYLISG
jgi:selenocysteine-specific elongation factor